LIRRRGRVAAPNHDRWLISYADFLTLLLALFVVLFASAKPDRHKARQVSYAVTEALHEAAPVPVPVVVPNVPVPALTPAMGVLNQSLAEEVQSGKIEIHLDARGLVVSLRQAAYFPRGGDEIAPSEFDSLERIARAIRDLPNAVQLEGHTDSAPIHNSRFRSNWDLSAARGIAMLELFTDRFGIPADRLAVSGYAETKPVDSNDSAEGRAHNRRVDIVILNQ
jgi:chemotaxis protein MotB